MRNNHIMVKIILVGAVSLLLLVPLLLLNGVVSSAQHPSAIGERQHGIVRR